MRQCILLISALFFLSCGQWKVSSLKSDRLCTLAIGAQPGHMMINYSDSGFLDLTFTVKAHRGKLYTADNLLKRVQILERDGKPILVIGQKKGKEAGGVRNAYFNFNIIGSLAVDSDRNLYVQNRLSPSGAAERAPAERSEGNEELYFTPSYILVFNDKGNLQYTLGQKGTPDLPFYYIESLEIDKDDRLFVISRSFDTWSVFRFNKRKRDFYVNLGKNDFRVAGESGAFTGRIENIKTFLSGEKFLISVAYYDGSRFKFRKIFEYNINEGKMGRTVLDIPEPRNELFTLVDDKHIYLWNEEGKAVKFMICNFNSAIMNNIQIKFPENNGYFEDVFIDESGQFFSYHVGKKGIDILEWK